MWHHLFPFLKPGRRRTASRPRRTPARHCPRLEALEDRCLMSAGALDPTFGSGGIVAAPVMGVNAMAQQTDGKFVTAGIDTSATPYGAFAAARYNADGTLDTTFGSGGKVSTHVGNYYDETRAVAVQADGGVLVAGFSLYMVKGRLDGRTMNLVRYNGNGTLDTKFGSKGIISFKFSNTVAQGASALAVQGDGKIVVAGWRGSPDEFVLVRFNSNGTLDTSFGVGGSVQIAIASAPVLAADQHPIGLALQSDGKMIVSGMVYSNTLQDTEAALVRVNSNGTLDTTFGAGGVVLTTLGPSGTQFGGLALQPDGKPVIVGFAWDAAVNMHHRVPALARFNSDGSADSTFHGNGQLLLDIAGAPYYANQKYPDDGLTCVAIQADGKIVAGGLTDESGWGVADYGQFALLRLNGDGSVDSGFGDAGLVLTDVSPSGDCPNAIVLQGDGKIVLGGNALVRYLPSAPQIGSFTSSASTVASGSSLTLTAANLSDANPGSTIIQVAYYVQLNGTKTLLGYGTQSSPGVWTLDYTVNLAPGSYTLYAQAQDSFGVLGDLLAIDLTVQ